MTEWLNKNSNYQCTLQRLWSPVFHRPCSWTTGHMWLHCHYAFTVCAYFLSTHADPLVVMWYQKYMARCILYEHFQFCSWVSLTDSTLHTRRDIHPIWLLIFNLKLKAGKKKTWMMCNPSLRQKKSASQCRPPNILDTYLEKWGRIFSNTPYA